MGAGYIGSLPGIIKLVTLFVGFLVIVIAGYAFDNAKWLTAKSENFGLWKNCTKDNEKVNEDDNDDNDVTCPIKWAPWALVQVAIICFVMSLQWFIVNVLSDLSGTAKTIDFILHLCEGILLIIFGICGIIFGAQVISGNIGFGKCKAIKNEAVKEVCVKTRKTVYQPELFVTAGLFAMINGIVYIGAALISRK